MTVGPDQQTGAKQASIADEAKQRGDIEMSARFASSAVEERLEARRIEERVGRPGE
jgi:hypothetical protein